MPSAHGIGIEWCIIISLIVTLVGNAVLVPFCNSYEWALLSGTAIIAAGISPIWGLIFGFLREYITMSSKIAGFIITTALIEDFVFPAIISRFVTCDPMVFSWIIFSCSLGMFVLVY